MRIAITSMHVHTGGDGRVVTGMSSKELNIVLNEKSDFDLKSINHPALESVMIVSNKD